MRPAICDICGAVDRAGRVSTRISYDIKYNGIFYPEDLCINCTAILVDTLNLARKQTLEEQQKKAQEAQKQVKTNEEIPETFVENKGLNTSVDPESEETYPDDRNPATQ